MSTSGTIGVQEGDRLADFTLRARKVFQLANQEAHRLNHDYLGAEHLLLGLVKDDIGLASQLLRGSGCYLLPARSTVEKVAPATPGLVTVGNLAWAADVHRTVARATDEARGLRHPRVGTGHVLLAVLSESAATVVRVFADAAPDPDDMRAKVLAALTGTNWAVVEEYYGYEGYGPCPELVPSS